MRKYTLIAGRHILKYEQPFISIHREGQTLPVEADDGARLIEILLQLAPYVHDEDVDLINKGPDGVRDFRGLVMDRLKDDLESRIS